MLHIQLNFWKNLMVLWELHVVRWIINNIEKRANEKKLVDQLGVDFVNEDTHVLEETKFPALPIKSIIYRVCI